MSLSRRASVPTLLTCPHVWLVSKLIRHVTDSREIPVALVGNLDSEDNQYWDSYDISKMSNEKYLSSLKLSHLGINKTMVLGLLHHSSGFLPNRSIWNIVFKSKCPAMILSCHWQKNLSWSGRAVVGTKQILVGTISKPERCLEEEWKNTDR